MAVFVPLTLFLLVLLLAGMETGRRIRLRRRADEGVGGLNVIDGAIFGLLGLLLAFAFSGADSRYETRRQLIVTETNAIGTAWLRVDLLPATDQPGIRADLRQYVDHRIAYYRELNEKPEKTQTEFAESTALQGKIWSESIAAAREDSNPAVLSLVTSSLNDMIDITTTRAVALETHPPMAIYVLLFVLALASSLIAGFGMGEQHRRPWLHTLVYAVALTITIYTILDLEFPRAGIVRIDRYDRVLVQQRETMN